MMKKFFIKGLIGVLLASVALKAEIIFDLQAQHFSTAIEGKYKGARYELPKVYVSTNLAYSNGSYFPNDDLGYFNIEIKEPLKDWAISLDSYGYIDNEKRTIQLISESGKSINITYGGRSIKFDNNNSVYSLSGHHRITTNIVQNGNNIELYFNAKKIATANKPEFGRLKYVNIQMIVEYYYSSGRHYPKDYLNNLTIAYKE